MARSPGEDEQRVRVVDVDLPWAAVFRLILQFGLGVVILAVLAWLAWVVISNA